MTITKKPENFTSQILCIYLKQLNDKLFTYFTDSSFLASDESTTARKIREYILQQEKWDACLCPKVESSATK